MVLKAMGKNKINNCAVHKKIAPTGQKFCLFYSADVFSGHRTLSRIYEDSINVVGTTNPLLKGTVINIQVYFN